jgi:hypothetical protein
VRGYVTCACLFLTWWAPALPSGLSAEEVHLQALLFPARQIRIPIDCFIPRSSKPLSGTVPFHRLILEAAVTFACAFVRAAVHSHAAASVNLWKLTLFVDQLPYRGYVQQVSTAFCSLVLRQVHVSVSGSDKGQTPMESETLLL